MDLKVFDYGLKNRKPQEFIGFLETKCIEIVVDIRSSRSDMYSQWWGSGENFEKLLKGYHYEYLWYKELGIPWSKRNDFDSNPEGMRDYYLNEIISKNFKIFLKVYQLALNNAICLICVEDLTQTKYCHRIWLKQRLIEFQQKGK